MNTNNTPLEMFYRWERETPELTYTRQSLGGGQWIERTWREVGQRARKIASYLLEAKLPAQSNIGIWSGNSSDWIEVDLAIMMAGHVSVPLFAGQEIEATRYIINHSGIELLFCGATDFGAGHSIEGFSDLTVIACDGFEGQSVISIADIVSNYSALTESPIPDVDSLMTIVYSSG
ncbi:MAG: AMP-binding protein, partial [Pseudomonadota bacterium]|nr:AMP-binding protein [Pseudomonadota bacterium]